MTDKTVKKDADFYIEDQLYVFFVEDTLFKVHRSVLIQHSEVFKGMFVDGPPSPPNGDGSSDDNPIVLESISAFDFKAFLKIIYKSSESNFVLTPEEWMAVLCVAHRYQCAGFHTRALKYLREDFQRSSMPSSNLDFRPVLAVSPASCAIRILGAAESRNISVNYFADGVLRDTVLRRSSLSGAEYQMISSHLTAQLAHARELKFYNAGTFKNQVNGSAQDYEFNISRLVWPEPRSDDPHFSLFERMDEGSG
ncbi:hypothetical protein PENSPDRAFT_756898 [Peniophora sp. CONT]|nr:hypothetical protein PENSPDRAFT_756898 [Peniophora sp. CONT]